jgi:hypothetical protein
VSDAQIDQPLSATERWVLKEMRAGLSAQEQRIRALDTKATVFLGLTAVLLAASVALLGVDAQPWERAIGLVGAAMLEAAQFCIAVAVWPRRFNFPPNPRGLASYSNRPVGDLTEQLLHQWPDAYESNEVLLRSKARWVSRCMALLLAASVTVAIPQATSALRRSIPTATGGVMEEKTREKPGEEYQDDSSDDKDDQGKKKFEPDPKLAASQLHSHSPLGGLVGLAEFLQEILGKRPKRKSDVSEGDSQ